MGTKKIRKYESGMTGLFFMIFPASGIENDTVTSGGNKDIIVNEERIVNVSVVDRRVENMRNAGIEVEYLRHIVYATLGYTL